jgi:hypothetical protein
MLAKGNIQDTDDLERAANRWANYMVNMFTAKIATEPKVMLDFANRHQASTAIFATLDKANKPVMVEAGVFIMKDIQGRVVAKSAKPITLVTRNSLGSR